MTNSCNFRRRKRRKRGRAKHKRRTNGSSSRHYRQYYRRRLQPLLSPGFYHCCKTLSLRTTQALQTSQALQACRALQWSTPSHFSYRRYPRLVSSSHIIAIIFRHVANFGECPVILALQTMENHNTLSHLQASQHNYRTSPSSSAVAHTPVEKVGGSIPTLDIVASNVPNDGKRRKGDTLQKKRLYFTPPFRYLSHITIFNWCRVVDTSHHRSPFSVLAEFYRCHISLLLSLSLLEWRTEDRSFCSFGGMSRYT
jgi:hypothetical protein